MGEVLNRCMQNIMPEKSDYFKEEAICEVLTIPSQKPNIERILDIMVWPEIENIKLIETEVGFSEEGQRLSGTKLVVELLIKEKITYVAKDPTQSVHAVHYESLKSMFVIVPPEVKNKSVCALVKAGKISVTPYVEAVDSRMLDCRTIHKCIMMFLDVKLC